MPLQVTSGAASYDAFGGGVAVVPNYIEDVFSTWLYTGTGAAQTITNNIDLSTKGGLVWLKERNNARSHFLQDSARTITSYLSSDNTDAASSGTAVTALNTTGFTLGTQSGSNGSGNTYASWTFRKQPKFFDIVTYTGNGAASRNISHALGSKPGFVVLKRTDSTGNWFVAAWTGTTFRIGTDASPFALNSTNGFNTQNGAAATSTTFDPNEVTLSSNYGVTPSNANINGATYIAYLFAHDAGGFGLTGTDNVISCGSLTADSSGNSTVTLGYEPQWVMTKRSDGVGDWRISDIMRGMSQTTNFSLRPNLSNAEQDLGAGAVKPTSTGFTTDSNITNANQTYIYIAIRRGPMKVPTTGTKVFAPAFVQAAARYATRVQTGFPVDMTFMNIAGSTAAVEMYEYDRLRNKAFQTYSNAVEQSNPFGSEVSFASNTGFVNASASSLPAPSFNVIFLNFQRAPSVFDIVCYTGTGTSSTVTHNLGVAPEWVICKSRTSATYPDWGLWSAGDGIVNHDITTLSLNSTAAATYLNVGYSSRFTATTFRPDTVYDTSGNSKNQSGYTYVAYLFATCAGVSKVGYYEGTGTLTTINCGFVAGARFVIIKNVSSTGAWYVWDSSRGMVSGTDPSLQLNSTAAESNADSVYAVTTGFQLLASPAVAVNTNAAKYIFLAIA